MLWSLQICAWLRLGDHLIDYLNIYKQTILPTVDYGCIVWGDCAKNNSQRLERLQNQAMRTILSTNRNTCSQEMRSKKVTSTSIRKRTCFHSRMLQLKLAILFSELKGEIFGNGKRQE